ncbi:MAG TPA: hypothetical protein VFH61_04260 [Thermoleophilia bacterium]|nr:hypothetical protein [Thermoleophilia bacterium]
MPDLDRADRLCDCGAEAATVVCVALTEANVPDLAGASGPLCHAHHLRCEKCGNAWILVTSAPAIWYARGAHD